MVRMTADGEHLEAVRFANDPAALTEQIAKAGLSPQVVPEATYGWEWATEILAGTGAQVHLAHPLGIKAFTYRRVKNDVRDATDLADLLRMNRLPEAWIAPPAIRQLPELVRHRHKLRQTCSSWKNQAHAVLAKRGIGIPVADLFGVSGRRQLAALQPPEVFRTRLDCQCHIIEVLEAQIEATDRRLAAQLAGDPGYRAVRTIPGIAPGTGRGVHRRDRPGGPVSHPRTLGLLGGADPAPPGIGYLRAPRADHQARQQTAALGGDRGRATGPGRHPDAPGV